MYAAGPGIDLAHQGIRIDALELLQLAPIEHPRRQLVPKRRELLEDVGVRDIGARLALLAPGQAHLVEEDFAELSRRADIKGLASKPMNLGLELGQAGREIVGEAFELRPINLDALPLHGDEHGDQRALDRLVDCDEMVCGELRLEMLIEVE